MLVILLISSLGFTQETKTIDSTAVYILDKMSAIIGGLESVNFHLTNSEDKLDADNNIIKHYSTSDIYFSGSNKLMVKTERDEGKMGFWYDGLLLTYYNFDENNYVSLEAPETTMEMIDEMNKNYNFLFPAADFFYPTFTDDIIEHFDTVKLLGEKTIEGEECYHILASNENLNVQIFISNKTHLLPKHFVIIYKNKSNLQYQSTFSNWNLNLSIPDAAFDFLPPPTAKLISILKKS
jgi:hypothetical protein